MLSYTINIHLQFCTSAIHYSMCLSVLASLPSMSSHLHFQLISVLVAYAEGHFACTTVCAVCVKEAQRGYHSNSER